jgi:hypothetical protein
LLYCLPEICQWDFGGGVFSTGQEPLEIGIGAPGSFPVCLTVFITFDEQILSGLARIEIGDWPADIYFYSLQCDGLMIGKVT